MTDVWQENPNVQLVTLGGMDTNQDQERCFARPDNVLQLEHMTCESALARFYNAMDLVVVPSLFDAFNQVAAEAIACGTPVIAFDNSGPATVVVPDFGGRLARAFDTTGISKEIISLLASPSELRRYRIQGPRYAQKTWSYHAVGTQYQDLYRELVGK